MLNEFRKAISELQLKENLNYRVLCAALDRATRPIKKKKNQVMGDGYSHGGFSDGGNVPASSCEWKIRDLNESQVISVLKEISKYSFRVIEMDDKQTLLCFEEHKKAAYNNYITWRRGRITKSKKISFKEAMKYQGDVSFAFHNLKMEKAKLTPEIIKDLALL